MKKQEGIVVDWDNNIVIITKDYAKRANIRANPENEELRQYRKEGFKILPRTAKQKPNKVNHKGRDIPWMRDYIMNNGTSA